MGGTPNLLKIAVSATVDHTTTQNGIHEDNILCADCDNAIGAFDQYGYKVLTRNIDPQRIITPFGPKHPIYDFGIIDMQKFRLFLISLAWRAGIATDPMFQLVKLGVYEQRLKDALLGTPDLLEKITAVIILFRPPKYPDIMWSPFATKESGINVLYFYLPPWKIILKLDQRPFSSPFSKIELAAGRNAYAIVQNFWSVGELRLLRDFQQKSRQAKGLD